MYYKLNNNYPIISHIEVEDDFIKYDEANPPQELQDALNALSLNEAKESKRNEIRQAFTTQSELPVLVGTVNYHGGFDSAMKLDGAKRMVEALGGIEVAFYDADNLPHLLSLVEAQEVITAIGMDYQSKFANKQDKMVQVENAVSIEEVENASA